MLNELKNEANRTLTENGAVTNISTGSECLDFFATVGSIRSAEAGEIILRLTRAFAEDRLITMKTLFYARDVRGGLGERRVFRTCIHFLAQTHPEIVRKNLHLISEYGRWDDLLELIDTPCEKDMVDIVRKQLQHDKQCLVNGDEDISLLAKWMPSINTSNPETVKKGKWMAKHLGMSEKKYRKTLVALRNRIRIIENNLRMKDYTFDYSKQPSKALFKYRKAFMRNDGDRYDEYLSKVASGEAKMNTGTLVPYDIVHTIIEKQEYQYASASNFPESERKALDTTWNSLEDFGDQRNALCVIDGSGSMYSSGSSPAPIDVAISLGLYFAERNKGEFHNHFMTFSTRPKMIEVKGTDIVEKVQYVEQFNECANTNIQAVFELLLRTAVKNHVLQEEMPETIYIISDMEFDFCTNDADKTNFEYAKKIFAEAGYTLPNLVFWNVDSRSTQQPVSMNDRGVALVSGCTPRIFSMVASGDLDPVTFMRNVLGSERYAQVTV